MIALEVDNALWCSAYSIAVGVLEFTFVEGADTDGDPEPEAGVGIGCTSVRPAWIAKDTGFVAKALTVRIPSACGISSHHCWFNTQSFLQSLTFFQSPS